MGKRAARRKRKRSANGLKKGKPLSTEKKQNKISETDLVVKEDIKAIKTVHIAKQPVFYPIVGSLLAMGCIAFTIMMASVKDWGGCVLFGSSALLCSPMVIAFINCRIWFSDDLIVVQDFFRCKRTYHYSEITGISSLSMSEHLYFGKRHVELSCFSESQMEFYAYACRKYYTINKKNIPSQKNFRFDIFNGNIKNPMEFIIVYVLMGLLLTLVWIVFISCLYQDLDYETEKVVFNEYEEEQSFFDGKTIYLISDDEESYQITLVPENFSTDDLNSICDGKTQVTVKGLYCGKYNERYLDVRSISLGNKELLAEKETEVLAGKNTKEGIIILMGFTTCYFLFVLLSVIGGRNPQKHPHLARMCFKEEYIRHNFPGRKKRKRKIR